MILKIILFCSISEIICQQENVENQWYKAAVVEYHASDISGTSAEENLMARAKSHIDILKNIDQDLDIIIYPEKTVIPAGDILLVSTKIPKKYETIICNSTDTTYNEFLKLFSCASINHNTTIAITVIEKENCNITKNCGLESKDGNIYYNTVVVFDERGYVSGRYRKWNLFGEFQLSKPKELDVTVIKTKTNVSFGIFNCFDINFNVPSVNLTRDLNIKNIMFPNNWISELPYLTALQVQQMWAQENDVVLLAAGANKPQKGASGSGIYIGKNGPLERVFVGGNGGTKIIVQTVPNLNDFEDFTTENLVNDEEVDELANELDEFYLLRDLSMDDHSSVMLNETEKRIEKEVCNGESNRLCCNFDITINLNQSAIGKYRYKYHLVTFNGIRSFSGLRYAGIESCAVIACLNNSLTSCGLRFSNYSEIFWPIIFEKITVQATFVRHENRAQYPNSLLSSLRPILPKYTSWEKEEFGKNVTRRHILNKFEDRLLTFGIFGRDFSRDSSLIRPDSSSSRKLGQHLVIFSALGFTNLICLVLTF